ncbi:peptide chain release factor N(5)-glutamine methyltransferase [Jiella mangrovi]|uniref:Release factor glutamine methyltransferase n=1 Tax=Jiella mangrovi TaxID=2821407 RepID=A0ABS4BNS9_9HYPH|nr:peptide chain release factor N(5)-glutamine methyltransferase [Jiella mangrovi]MBP0618187.1 peptide chain release factor N(5)-glutamine methyltransferase [Jiella mangrovi]
MSGPADSDGGVSTSGLKAAERGGACLGELYDEGVRRLRQPDTGATSPCGAGLSPTPDLDARLLLAAVLGVTPSQIHRASARPVTRGEAEAFAGFLARRREGEPVHRIIGRRAFYEHEFELSPDTLEPRPETELLVDMARPFVDGAMAERGACLFADVGTGTGAIAVSLLALCPLAEAVAIDIAEGALVTARRNSEAAGVGPRFHPVLTDQLAGVCGPFDVIVSNPPYIPTNTIGELDVSVRRHDPMLALDGGPDGLAAYRAIAEDAGRVLRPGGAVIVEIGHGQAGDVETIFQASGFAAAGRSKDLAGIERVLVLTSGRQEPEAFAKPASF